jgi:RNA polymerase sigma-70 factor (ECF subfamily)
VSIAPAPEPGIDRSDDDLLLLASEGNNEAFTVFYDRTASRVLGLVTRVLIDPSQSEEVTQDVYLEVWQNVSRFDPAKGKALSWLLTMARRRAIDRVRASQSSRERDLSVGIRDFEEARNDVEDTVEITLEHQRITRALRTLTTNQQQALELTYFQGLTNTEAASTAGVPVGTMKTRLRDALSALRTRVADPAAA